MLLIIIVSSSILIWQILAYVSRLTVAAIAFGCGVVLALQIRSTERAILAFASGDHSLAAFDRNPTRGERRAMRMSLKRALRHTEFRSLFPSIAERTQQFVRASAR